MVDSNLVERKTILNLTIIIEALLLLSATIWGRLSHVPLMGSLKFKLIYVLVGIAAGVLLSLSGFILIWMGKHIGWLSGVRDITYNQIAPVFSKLHLLDLLIIAGTSGFCEEVLFRGVMQHQFGIWSTCAIFGVFHCPSLRFLGYGIWVFMAGLVLSFMYQITGNLWCPILAHGVSNYLSLICLRHMVKPKDNS